MFQFPVTIQSKGVSFQVSESLVGSCSTNRVNCYVFNGTFKGQSVAVKKFSLSSNIHKDEQHWDKLIKLRDDHVVQYLLCGVENNIR